VGDASERVDRQRVGDEKLGCGVLATAGLKRPCDQHPVAWAGSNLGGGLRWSLSLVYWALRRVLELVLLVLGPLFILGPLRMLPEEEVMP